MRVLHAYKIYMPEVFGGIPQVISMLAKIPGSANLILVARFRGWRRRYEVEGTAVEAASSLGTLFSMPIAIGYPLSFIRHARSSDVVVHHAPFPLTDVGIFLGLPKRAKLIVYWHAEVVGKPLLLKLIAPFLRHSLNRADHIVVSDSSIVEHSPFLQPFAAKCQVAPFGCDFEYWSKLSDEQKSAVGSMRKMSDRTIVAVGRLVGYKGYDVLIRAMQNVDGRLKIIGDGPLKDELQQLTRDLGVSGKVAFLGSLTRDMVKVHLHSAAAFAFPSISASEAFGIVQLEAMACGTPVVNTALRTAVPHIARDGLEGITVPVGDPAALGDALSKILDDSDLAKHLGTAGAARARTVYNEPVFIARMQDIYRQGLIHPTGQVEAA